LLLAEVMFIGFAGQRRFRASVIPQATSSCRRADLHGSLGRLAAAAGDQALVARGAVGAIEAQDMRHAGRLIFVEYHLVVPSGMTVATAHMMCDRIEAALRDEMVHLIITIRVEPEEGPNEAVYLSCSLENTWFCLPDARPGVGNVLDSGGVAA
jgi:hypothetical protein